MGDRYFLTVRCNCGTVGEEVYYAPTCGIVDWTCPGCGDVMNLEEYTGITKEEASTLDEMKALFPRPDGAGA